MTESETPPAPSRLSLSAPDLVQAARTAGLVLVAYLLVCELMAGLLTVLQDEQGGVTDSLRGGVIIAALGLHSRLFTEVHADTSDNSAILSIDRGATFTFSLVPLLVLGAALFLGHLLSRRSERTRPSAGALHAAAVGVLTAAGAVAVLAVLARLSRSSDGFSFQGGGSGGSGGSGTGGAEVGPLLLWGIPLLAAPCVAGRLAELRRRTGQPALRNVVADRSWGLSGWFTTAALHAGVSAVLLTVAAIVYGLTTSDQEISEATSSVTRSDVGGLLLVLFLLPNIALAATGFFLGFSVSAGGFSSDTGGDATYGLLHGSTPTATYLWCLAPLLAAALVGTRRALRTPEASRPLDGWWQAGVGSLLLWVPLSLLLRVGYGGGGFLGIGTVTVGFTVLSVLVLAFGWGVLVLFLGRQLAPRLVVGNPRAAARLGGARTDRGWQVRLAPALGIDVPAEPDLPHADVLSSRPPSTPVRTRTLVLIGVVAILVAAGGTSYALVESRYSARTAAEGYLSALEKGHVTEALASMDLSRLTNRTLLRDDALPAGRRITDAHVTGVRRSGTSARVTVTYRLAGNSKRDTLLLRAHGSRGLVFHDWQVVGGLGKLAVSVDGDSSTATVNGISVAGQDSVPVLPGVYVVSVPATGALEADDETVSIGFDSNESVQVLLHISDTAVVEANAVVLRYLRACLARATTLDTSCGFSTFTFGDHVERVRWTLVGTPDFDPQQGAGDGTLRLSGTVEAHVTGVVVENDLFGGPPTRTPLDETVTNYVSGTVDFSSGAAVFTPSS